VLRWTLDAQVRRLVSFLGRNLGWGWNWIEFGLVVVVVVVVVVLLLLLPASAHLF